MKSVEIRQGHPSPGAGGAAGCEASSELIQLCLWKLNSGPLEEQSLHPPKTSCLNVCIKASVSNNGSSHLTT
ncbi:hypothetical protein ACRRTK_014123 [Alexandromys fortis]